jgi:DeoR family transcriptional regulator of aga operon
MTKAPRNTLSRRAKILELLQEKGEISVLEISSNHNISDVSVRNDLAHLEQKGLLIRTRGGAIKTQPVNFDLNLNQRLKTNYKEKQRIGRRAASYIKDNDTIVMDNGSTTLEVARNLEGLKNIKLITNSLPIADLVADFAGVNVIIPGGELRSEMRSLVGSMAEKSLSNYHCDIAFLGADGVDVSSGIYTPQIEEAALSQKMIEIANRVIVVCDSTKFGRKSFVKIGELKDIDVIITDNRVKEKDIEKLLEKDITIDIV